MLWTVVDRNGNVETVESDRAFVGKQGELKFVNNDDSEYGETVGVYSAAYWNKFFAKGNENQEFSE